MKIQEENSLEIIRKTNQYRNTERANGRVWLAFLKENSQEEETTTSLEQTSGSSE